jgi:site-specific recombinase XerD
VCRTVIDFSKLQLPEDVRLALAEAFWNHVGVRSVRCILTQWAHLKTFSRFAAESRSLNDLGDMRRELLVRYIEWLNAQRRPSGEPWSKSSRSGAYTTLRKLLQWLERCRPSVLRDVEYPFNPFPWRNRDTKGHPKLRPEDLRAILQACERSITHLRTLREVGKQAMAATRAGAPQAIMTLGALLECIDQHFGGIVPPAKVLSRAGNHPLQQALRRYGGAKGVEPYLYPRAESLLPYYLAILIHTAGNPEPIAELDSDCLQPIPLLDDRQLLKWSKHRAGAVQRRSFSITDQFEPPALVHEILEWTERLRPRAPVAQRSRLLLFKGARGVSALSASTAKHLIGSFLARHGLPRFALASVRPSVLTAFYRASGDLRQVKTVANHAHLATTVRYVEAPEVEAQHRVRIAALQSAFLGHIERPQSKRSDVESNEPPAQRAMPPAGPAVSMFGFDCTDPLAGIAPGTRRGELCTNFLGCFTCPNAVIAPGPTTLARLLQAREHLRAAATQLHPARWEALYAPQLRILDEDILTRFAARELAAAQRLVAQLPPLPDLR